MTSPAAPNPAPTDSAQALLDAIAAVLEPLARLAVARGVPFDALEEAAKLAVVRAAHAAHPDLPDHRRVSRISTSTGLSRREVTRLVQAPARPTPPPSSASELFSRWMTDRRWRDRNGQPRVLPRQGEAPSFEVLAQSVTRDVHPRSLLEEMTRLGLVTQDAATDTVRLATDAFVPQGDQVRMARMLADNVGDHLSAAVINVLGDGRQHFEQAIFADGLSAASVAAFRQLVKAQWQVLRQTVVPALQAMVDEDEAEAKSSPGPRHRVRMGLYAFETSQDAPEAAPDAPGPADASMQPLATARSRRTSRSAKDSR